MPPEELETARTFISESSDPIDGLRGVLWAVVNTKEFIVKPLIAVHFRRHAATENGREMSEMIELYTGLKRGETGDGAASDL